MTKIEIKKELKSKLDKICDNEYFVDGKGDYDINQALESLISVYDKNIALNIKKSSICFGELQKRRCSK